VNSPELFYEDYDAALRDDVQAIGGAKAVGMLLWPEKDPLAARNKLNDSLNVERRERLTHEQESFIKRKAREVRGFSAALYCECDETGFKRPEPRDPLDEAAQLQREFIHSVEMQKRIAAKLEALTQAPIRVVR
jgi:hypothetical protein